MATIPHRVEGLASVRTKIVATVGPASRSPGMLRALAGAGVDVFRLNFSHGSHADHAAIHAEIRRIGEETGQNLAILQDLGGPKIRLGKIPGDQVDCQLGSEFTLVVERTSDSPHQLTCTYRQLAEDLKVGNTLVFADGLVEMVVDATEPGECRLRVTQSGVLRSSQGINLPGAQLAVDALTEKDLSDLAWTVDHPVEFVGLSFVRRASDVSRLREEMVARKIDARIIAKIEKPEAVADLTAILAQTDAVMIARGDLGVEVDPARVPALQKQIIDACRQACLPVITATQMLTSMETESRPTRAEASDVFNAVLDGTDAVMLSGETAIGHNPVRAVEYMSRIVREAEESLGQSDRLTSFRTQTMVTRVSPITASVVDAASLVARQLSSPLLVVATHSGRTALVLSKLRQLTPTLALADSPEEARRLALCWGVTPIHLPHIENADEALNFASRWAYERKLIRAGDRIVLVVGASRMSPLHNSLLVHEVGPEGG